MERPDSDCFAVFDIDGAFAAAAEQSAQRQRLIDGLVWFNINLRARFDADFFRLCIGHFSHSPSKYLKLYIKCPPLTDVVNEIYKVGNE